MEEITAKERHLLEQFRQRLGDLELADYYGHDAMLVRWLRARAHDLDKAESMLRQHLEWKKSNKIDDLNPEQFSEQLTKQVPFIVSGKDSSGCIVIVVPFGQWDCRAIVEAGQGPELTQFIMGLLELMMRLYMKESEPSGEILYQGNIVIDYSGFSLRQITSKKNVDFILELVSAFQNNYPEVLKLGVVVNAPKIFEVLFSLCKPLITARTLAKLHIYGSNTSDWKSFLRKNLPPETLPSQYGGSNTACFHCKIQDSEALFIQPSKPLPVTTSKQVTVSAGCVTKAEVEVKEDNSKLKWTFRTSMHDIGFQLIKNDNEALIPLHLVDSHVITPYGMIKDASRGKYTFCFDNTHSRFKSKELSYSVSLEDTTGCEIVAQA